MTASESDLAWNLFIELRKEIIETQRIRAQVIGFKITFCSTAIGVIIAGAGRWPLELLVLPPLAAVFFDTLVSSYGVAIKRMGYYCRHHLEPAIRRSLALSEGFLLWHEFLRSAEGEARRTFAFVGNVGITLLTAVPAIATLGSTSNSVRSGGLLALLVVALVYDYWIVRVPHTYAR